MALLAGVGGFFGAMCRWAVDGFISRRVERRGVGIVVVNIVGSFLIGVAAALGDGTAATVVSVGFLGALTTFSTAMVDVVMELVVRRWVYAVVLALGVFVACVAAAGCGLGLAQVIVAG